MFKKILIANRGEIAVRIIRACREMGISTVAVYSEADESSLHVRLADESVCIGEPMSAKSYLNIESIIRAASETGAEAIHPGYGYLAEREAFAVACAENRIVFIGPTPANLQFAGDKIRAKQTVQDAGVPVIPSSPGNVADVEAAHRYAKEIGYPVMIKSSGGGGGRGIRICRDERELKEEFPIARMEAKAAFDNDALYLEKFIIEPRHIEFQVFGDVNGTIIHLGERECSIQRRYQKLIEEAPSPRLTPELRKKMGEAAITVARSINYFNAGTVEFLLDSDDHFYFMEINSRIQVEHPITEMVTGIDLVKEQIRLSAGETLDYSFEDIQQRGWAIECRINAENPDMNFMPSPGTVKDLILPGGLGVRVDTHLYQGYELPIYYDSLIAKLVAFSLSREVAIDVMKRALREFTVQPLKTTIPLYLKIMDDPDFIAGRFDTGFIERYLPDDDDDDDDEEDEN